MIDCLLLKMMIKMKNILHDFFKDTNSISIIFKNKFE